MALINDDIYRRKCQIVVRFRFLCTNFDVTLNVKASRHPGPVVYTQNVNNIEHFQKVLT